MSKSVRFGAAACALAFIAAIYAMPASALAAGPATAGSCGPKDTSGCYLPLTTIPGAFTENQPTNPTKVIESIYGVSIAVAAVLATAMIIWAGVEYVTTEAITGKSDARERIEGAIWGLVLLLSSYIILKTINVNLVNINLNLATDITGSLVSKDALDQINKTVQAAATAATSVADQKQASVDRQQQVASTTESLKKQLTDPNLTPSQKVALENKLTFANTVTTLEQQNQQRLSNIQNINSTLAKGDIANASTQISSLKQAIASQIDQLKSIKVQPSDTQTANTIAVKIQDLESQSNDMNRLTNLMSEGQIIATRISAFYSNAKPSTANMTADAFEQELVAKKMYDTNTDKMDTPVNLINDHVSGTTISHPELGSIAAAYAAWVAATSDTDIQARVNCYQTYLQKGSSAATAAGCASFN